VRSQISRGPPFGEGECPDLAEIVRKEIFVDRVRVDMVPGLPDFYDAGGGGLEDEEIVHKIRVRVLLPPVSHPLRELFCFRDRGVRLFTAGHF
jgi:hypothetical protein